jgi:hypothetical protein
MSDPDEQGGIFRAPAGPQFEEPPQPTADGSAEAMRRLRHPFDVQPTDVPDEHSASGTAAA